MKLRHLTISALALILMTSCGDATGVTADDLTGTWTASSMVFTSTADPTLSADIVAVDGATLTLVLVADTTYTLTVTVPPDPVEIDMGSYEVVGSILTLSPSGTGSPEPFALSRNGNTMTLTDSAETFDFTPDVDEAATLVITLSR